MSGKSLGNSACSSPQRPVPREWSSGLVRTMEPRGEESEASQMCQVTTMQRRGALINIFRVRVSDHRLLSPETITPSFLRVGGTSHYLQHLYDHLHHLASSMKSPIPSCGKVSCTKFLFAAGENIKRRRCFALHDANNPTCEDICLEVWSRQRLMCKIRVR